MSTTKAPGQWRGTGVAALATLSEEAVIDLPGLAARLGSMARELQLISTSSPLWAIRPAGIGDAIEQAQRIREMAHALTAVLSAEVVSRRIADDAGLSRNDWVAAHAPNLEGGDGAAVTAVGAALLEVRWQGLADKVRGGRATVDQAAVIIRFYNDVHRVADSLHLAEVIAGLVDQVEFLGVKELRQLVAQARATLRPPKEVADEEARGRAGRSFTKVGRCAGLIEYRLRLDPEGAAIIDAAIDPLARPRPDLDWDSYRTSAATPTTPCPHLDTHHHDHQQAHNQAAPGMGTTAGNGTGNETGAFGAAGLHGNDAGNSTGNAAGAGNVAGAGAAVGLGNWLEVFGALGFGGTGSDAAGGTGSDAAGGTNASGPAGLGYGEVCACPAGCECRTDCATPGAKRPDPRLAATRRADALLELVGRAVAAPEGVTRTPRTSLVITISFEALFAQLRGLAGSGVTDTGEVLSAATIRRLACEAGILPVVLGAQSQLLDLGSTTRYFSPAQRRALKVRDRGCTYPGCSIPAQWCEAHHVVHWAHGGPTDLANAALLCGRHHTLELTATVTPFEVTWHPPTGHS